jgi:hypothetical protein
MPAFHKRKGLRTCFCSTLFVFGAAHLERITDHFKKEGYKVEGFHL